jgi:hypothetical protein
MQPADTPSAKRERRAAPRRLGNFQESALLFVILYAIYAFIGYRLVVDQHVVVLDGLSRLAHAYFAWYNEPAKLASIGFEWPPVMTMVFLPLALIKPLATSFAALPLTSALFGAGLVVMVNRILSTFGMRLVLRLPLVLLFAANPMLVYYAANGMAEVVYLFFLVLALFFLIRWYRSGHTHTLALCGGAIALGALARYELIAFAIVMGVGILWIIATRARSRQEVSGSFLLYIAPIAYGIGGWCFFNWLIIGNPLFWVEKQAEKNVVVGRGVAGHEHLAALPIGDVLHKVWTVNLELFPLTLIIVPALLIAFAFRRDAMCLILAALASLNALMTTAFILNSHDESLLQLRYNMRAMPVALIAAGWLFWLFRDRIARMAIWAVTAAILALSLPLTWHTMQTYPYEFEEQAFTRALFSGEDQEGTFSIGNYHVGVAPIREMSDYVTSLHPSRDAILTDDESQTFSVMLASGHPDWFRDRIDHGDKSWQRYLRDPYGKVDYIMVSRIGIDIDHVRYCYPQIADGGLPGTKVLLRNERFVLLKVAKHAPKGGTGVTHYPSACPL